MMDKKMYIPPLLDIEELTTNPNMAGSGNSQGEHGVPKSGNADNNMNCWAKDENGLIYDFGNATYICMPDATYPF